MGKIKRKPRNKLAKKLNTLKPVTIEDIGSENDPCFGLHYNPQEDACSRCGDSELCAIKLSQNNLIKREKAESKSSFKDIEEDKLEKKKMERKKIRKKVLRVVKDAGKEGIELQELINQIHIAYMLIGYTQDSIERIIMRMVELDKIKMFPKTKKIYEPD